MKFKNILLINGLTARGFAILAECGYAHLTLVLANKAPLRPRLIGKIRRGLEKLNLSQDEIREIVKDMLIQNERARSAK